MAKSTGAGESGDSPENVSAPAPRFSANGIAQVDQLSPQVVAMPAVRSEMQRGVQLDIGTLSRSLDGFFGTLNRAQGQQDQLALQDQHDALEKQATEHRAKALSDAEHAGKEADPELMQWRAYKDTFLQTRGGNVGQENARKFLTWAEQQPPGQSPTMLVDQWRKDNHFDTGEALFDASANAQFNKTTEAWSLNYQRDSVKAARLEGVQSHNGAIARQVEGTEPLDIQGMIAQRAALLPPSERSQAAPQVIQQLLGAATTPAAIARIDAALTAKGSGRSPETSFRDDLPDAYNAWSEKAVRQTNEVNTLEAHKGYAALSTRVQDAVRNNDLGGLSDAFRELNVHHGKWGGDAQFLSMRGQIGSAANQLFKRTADLNRIDGMFAPGARSEDRDASLWEQKGDEWMTARGLNPLSGEAVPGGTITQSQAAADAVSTMGTIPGPVKTNVSAALLNTTDPKVQQTAYEFYDRIAKGPGGPELALSMMDPKAQIVFQHIRGLTGASGNISTALSQIALTPQNAAREVPDTELAGKEKPAEARSAITSAVTTAFNSAQGTNGWIFGPNVTVSQDLQQQVIQGMKASALFAANRGTLDLGQLAKDAVQREMANITVIPGVDGKRIAVYTPNTRTEVPRDPGDLSKGTMPRVRLGVNVYNPQTRQTENTTDNAEADLKRFAEALPDIVGNRQRLSLDTRPYSANGNAASQYGLYPILNGAEPVIVAGGDYVRVKRDKPIETVGPAPEVTPNDMIFGGTPTPQVTRDTHAQITVSADAAGWQKSWNEIHGNQGIVWMQIQVPDPSMPGGTMVAHQAMLRPRLAGTLRTEEEMRTGYAGRVTNRTNEAAMDESIGNPMTPWRY